MNRTSPGLNAIMTRLLEAAMDLNRYQENSLQGSTPPGFVPEADGDFTLTNAGLAGIARRLLKEADDRERHFAGAMFWDPAWRVLLDLYVQAAERQPVSVTSACLAARVPATTGLRCVTALISQGIVEKIADAKDRRRFYVKLSPAAFDDMSHYLAGVAGIDTIAAPTEPGPLRHRR